MYSFRQTHMKFNLWRDFVDRFEMWLPADGSRCVLVYESLHVWVSVCTRIIYVLFYVFVRFEALSIHYRHVIEGNSKPKIKIKKKKYVLGKESRFKRFTLWSRAFCLLRFVQIISIYSMEFNGIHMSWLNEWLKENNNEIRLKRENYASKRIIPLKWSPFSTFLLYLTIFTSYTIFDFLVMHLRHHHHISPSKQCALKNVRLTFDWESLSLSTLVKHRKLNVSVCIWRILSAFMYVSKSDDVFVVFLSFEKWI